jgi:hypothetical protein
VGRRGGGRPPPPPPPTPQSPIPNPQSPIKEISTLLKIRKLNILKLLKNNFINNKKINTPIILIKSLNNIDKKKNPEFFSQIFENIKKENIPFLPDIKIT